MNFITKNKKWLKIGLYTIIIGFSIIGFLLTSVFFAVKLNLTKHGGSIDFNDRFFQEISDKEYSTNGGDSIYEINKRKAALFSKIIVLNEFYPKNAELILNAFTKNNDIIITEKMFEALNLKLANNKPYQDQINSISINLQKKTITDSIANYNLYEWMNTEEWQVLKASILKDEKIIDSVERVSGVNSRMIVSILIGEQIRLFHSNREAFKKWMQPLKILTTETKFSLGVTGIKEITAMKTENYLKDSNSVFYIGEKYAHLLNFNTSDTKTERYTRLTNSKNHYYSYLYAALSIRQINEQWKRSGFDISHRPEVLATLFNLGYEVSKPKENPSVGGSKITVNNKVYTFGSLAFEFYFSGELEESFPAKYSVFQ